MQSIKGVLLLDTVRVRGGDPFIACESCSVEFRSPSAIPRSEPSRLTSFFGHYSLIMIVIFFNCQMTIMKKESDRVCQQVIISSYSVLLENN